MSKMFSMTGRVALVTGASRGLGFAIERPKSVTTANVKAWLKGEAEIWE
jgi:NADP-dependent 3-hydroxy acid dehydrogenase YdfG